MKELISAPVSKKCVNSKSAKINWIVAIIIATTPLLMAPEAKAQASSACRSVPSSYTWGQPLTVSIDVTPSADVLAWAVEEYFPDGWTITNVNQSGTAFAGIIKWGVFFDGNARQLTYQAMPPAGATNTASFTGLVSFDGASVSIGCQSNTAFAWPRLGVPHRRTDGQFEFTVSGLATQRCTIEASTTLTGWVDVGLITNTTGAAQFVDATATNYSTYYYRARLLSP